MSKVLAVISFIDQHGRPIDPGFGGGIEAGGGRPDNELPGTGPVDPGFGGGIGGPVDPGFGFPLPPVRPDNSLPGGRPERPENGLPTYPVRPDNGLPSPPTVWPKPPVGTWPPPQPVYPSHPIYPTDGIDNSLPLPPGSIYPPLPPEVAGGKIIAFCWIVGVGYRWVVLDPSLKPGFPLPKPPVKPDQGLPTTPSPK